MESNKKETGSLEDSLSSFCFWNTSFAATFSFDLHGIEGISAYCLWEWTFLYWRRQEA